MEQAIANVVRVDIITEDTTPMHIPLTCANEVGSEAKISEGTEEILRSKNKIIAQNKYEDLVIGYDNTLKDVVLVPDAFALIDGGTLATLEDDEHYTYDGPQIGAVLNRKKFTMDVWTEEKDADGDVKTYVRFRFKHCKGKPVKFSAKDGAFFAPEYTVQSRAKMGETPVGIMNFDAMPGDTLTAAQLLAYNTQIASAAE